MIERLIELFQELTEDEKDMILDRIEHPTKRENPVTEATGFSPCEGSVLCRVGSHYGFGKEFSIK